ncbi:MAG: hypothetical protein M1837_004972 [Sclerophora amabilis]|nr:MAG: hypothetical protein M1837_004972 [Sclerophora amabilis]
MDQRAEIPPGLPRTNPTVSYWQDPPDNIAHLRSTDALPPNVEYVIVGSGITGACIAHKILSRRPEAEILMLEARQACSGATGRNGGHTKGGSYRSFLDNADTLGLAEAVKIATLEYDCMKQVHEFARQNKIDCDSHPTDTVDVFFDQAQLDGAVKAVNFMREVIPPYLGIAKYTFYTQQEARRRFLTPEALGAVSYEAGSISPYKFVTGILKLSLAKGLNLQTNTAVTLIHQFHGEAINSPQWIVDTSRGKVLAEKVVLATNGYTSHLYPALQRFIVPLRGQVAAQRPGKGLPQTGLATTYSFIYEGGYDYMISRPPGSNCEGDIVIGGGLTKSQGLGLNEYGETDDTVLNEAISRYLEQSTSTFFGANWGVDHEQGRIRREWTGIMGYTPDGFPLVDEVPQEKNLYIAAAFQGHGRQQFSFPLVTVQDL